MNRYSIILPVRNGGAYVKECVASVLAQRFPYFNLHILENCSTDGTYEWLKTLQDSRIIIEPATRPLSMSENWARIKQIKKNEYITLIGHDDILFPDYLEEMEQLIQKHPHASLFQTHFRYIDADGGKLRSCLPMPQIQYAYEFLACHMCNTIDSTGTGYMMRSVDYEIAGGIPCYLPNLIFSDYILWIKLSSLSYKATSAKETFAYRINNSVSKLTNGEDYSKAFEQYLMFINSQKGNEGFKEVIDLYGHDFLIFYCQAMAHRLLKMPRSTRQLTVRELVDKFKEYAGLIIPEQRFEPLEKPLIRLAKQLDENAIGRRIFKVYQILKRK